MFEKKISCISGGLKSINSSAQDNIDERVSMHPCFSEEASHHYARMHVAVAPECNIQCNYCNRKYDCVNESRPGVASRVLTPEEAVQNVVDVSARLPGLKVVGIAGPGDPLANPERTFRTFELLNRRLPGIKLCLSTNGLTLPDYITELKGMNVQHVTITINTIDPEVGKMIYHRVRFKDKTYKGIDGARILYERQMQGLALLTINDILCKINSVLIPGINDTHLASVSKKIKSFGAFIHNIVPLIPCSGSYFGDQGFSRPLRSEVRKLQDACGGSMKMMRHCRQCRADAVGILAQESEIRVPKKLIPDYRNPEINNYQHSYTKKEVANIGI